MTEDFNISGTWVNRMTGDKIVVRNTIIDGDDMIILTSDGRQLSMAEFQNYIQMSDENDGTDHTMELGDIKGIENERRVVVGKRTNNVQSNSQNNPYYFYDNNKQVEVENSSVNIEVSESEKLLDKLFKKIDLEIDVKVDLNCKNFPVKELNMLQMIYDVSTDDISDYIIKNIINEEVFRSAVSTYINEKMNT